MARYHFHFRNRDVVLRDDDGVNLGSLAAAHAHAWKLIMKTVIFTSDQAGARDWVVDVELEGHVQLTVLFPALVRGGPKAVDGASAGFR